MDRSSSSPSPSSYRSSQSQSESHSLSPKESIWALYCRSMLLWNFCSRLRKDTCPESEKAEYALEAWVETQAIQDSLDMHVCNLHPALTYMAREYIYKCVLRSLLDGALLIKTTQYADDDYSCFAQVRP